MTSIFSLFDNNPKKVKEREEYEHQAQQKPQEHNAMNTPQASQQTPSLGASSGHSASNDDLMTIAMHPDNTLSLNSGNKINDIDPSTLKNH